MTESTDIEARIKAMQQETMLLRAEQALADARRARGRFQHWEPVFMGFACTALGLALFMGGFALVWHAGCR